jgi:hypothetical protein
MAKAAAPPAQVVVRVGTAQIQRKLGMPGGSGASGNAHVASGDGLMSASGPRAAPAATLGRA